MYTYIITPNAQRQLEQEIAYSEEQWGKRHAAKYQRGLLKQVHNIARNPKVYALNPEFGDDARSVRYKGNYIVYRIKEAKKLVVIAGFPNIHRHIHTLL